MPLRARRAALLTAVTLLLSSALPARAENAALPDLHWRQLGPFRAGWSTMAAGVPDQPDTFFFGAAGGGVWKTQNAGRTWAPLFDGAGPSSSVGAIAVAGHDGNVIYVGTGQPEPRYDIAAGDGVYRSADGGKTWTHVGLEQTRHIGAILVDRQNSDTLLVGAVGHLFGPNAERGVFRSEDGGQHWAQTLAISPDTGVVDLAADPTQPNIVFAAAWQWRNYPWLSYFTPIEGPGSGIYKSLDGGKTWARLNGEGFPDGALGRIGLAVTHTAQGIRVFASVASSRPGGVRGLYRSDDGGGHWLRVNDSDANTSWYNSRITIAPDDADTVYTFGQSIHRSRDAGKTFDIIKGAPGGDDYHQMWINPKHPERMVVTSDQGTVVSVDSGRSWSDWYNQPTGQFYHLAADNRFPYWIYAGQQDSGTVGIASRSDYGSITFRDWHPVGGDERDDDLPDPNDPNIVYSSGLGGRISRWDARNGQSRNITPWPVSSYGQRQTTVKYRYTWITPLAITPKALYVGAQTLFKSTDRGEHWRAISPDLTRDKTLAAPLPARCGGNVTVTDAGDCGYGVIFNIAPSPRAENLIWIGTDNGRVQLTRDGGQHWANVTPPGLPAWARVNTVDPSALAEGTAYVAVDNHRQDDFAPYAWRTHDYGKTWAAISAGLPAGHFVAVVRADPVRAGLLYAGTDAGVYVSLDDGDHWQPLQLNLPQAWVRDLLVKGNDLIAATQGRAIWLLDDLSPLRQQKPGDGTRLYAPATAYRLHPNNNKDTPLPLETAVGENPPPGAVIDYRLEAGSQGPVALEIRDARGALVRRYASDDVAPSRGAEQYFADVWLQPARPLPASPGAHRVIWDLRYPRPKAQGYEFSIAAVPGRDTATTPAGAFVPPGRYEIVLKAGGRDYRTALILKPDPRVTASAADYAHAAAFSQKVSSAIEQAYIGNGEVESVRAQILALQPTLTPALKAATAALLAATEPLVEKEAGIDADFATVGAAFAGLESDMESADAPPTQGQQQVFDDYSRRLSQGLSRWQQIKTKALPKLNISLEAAVLPILKVPAPEDFAPHEEGGGVDLP
ncbi:MAG: hypothetical protein M0Q15_18985 [Nevskia sp.]|jgi:photosystem II stability/assembly factor-like uncharacterized protein|nr:hypothetical protein [Nevskia sp.]